MKNGRGKPEYACRFCGWRKADAWPALSLHLATEHPEVRVVEPMRDARAVGTPSYIAGVEYGRAWSSMKIRHRGAL